MNFTDTLKVAQNIIAQKGISGVDLFAEIAKSQSLMNQMSAQGGVGTEAPPETPPQPLTDPITTEQGQTSGQAEGGLEVPV